MPRPDPNVRDRQPDPRRTAPPRSAQAGDKAKPHQIARRSVLDGLRSHSTSHAGLWLDRFLPAFNGERGPEARAELIRAATTTITTPLSYSTHLQRWTAHLDALVAGALARTTKATVDGRMIVGLGAESVLEAGICLHRTYGVPFIPGSALKGLAAGFAARTLADTDWRRQSGRSHAALFGTHEAAGCVVFHDALWVPDGPDARIPLDLDVMTVHHTEYYQGKADPRDAQVDTLPPADWDDPNPVSFVTARGTYLIALEGPAAWTDVAIAILKLALRQDGVGAKTAAGYGRLEVAYTSAAEAEAMAAERAVRATTEQARLAELAKLDRKRRVDALLRGLKVNNASTSLPELLGLADDDAERHALALACEERLTKKVVRNAQREDKPWVRPLTAVLYPSYKGSS